MLADGRTVPPNEVVRTDVCIVGAGPTGIALARELTKAKLDVLLLERGPDPRVAPPAKAETAINVGLPYRVERSRAFAVGGATHLWHLLTPLGDGFGRLRELDEEDFRARPWIPHSGWPFGREHLDPYYRRARSLFDLPSAADAEDDGGRSEGVSPFSADGHIIETRLFHFANPGMFAGGLRRELENSPDALLLSNSAATEIIFDTSTGSVSSVKVMTSPSDGYVVEARVYVLAGGGIENPRLLLSSRSGSPEGMANGHDLVGRFFMEHPHYSSGYLVPRSRSVFEDTASYAIHLRKGVPIQRKYGLADEIAATHGLARSVLFLTAEPVTVKVDAFRYSDRALESLAASTRLRDAVARRHLTLDVVRGLGESLLGAHHVIGHQVRRGLVRLRQRRGVDRYIRPHLFWLRTMAEQIPNPESRVRLSESRDEFGVPLAELDWRLTEQDITSMKTTQKLFGEAQTAAGHQEAVSFLEGRDRPAYLGGGNHHMGTTRMAASPRQGVVDPDCRVHGHDNLFVAGSSVFPTVGYANPTLTAIALAIRLSDHLASRVRDPVRVNGPAALD